MPHSPYTKTIHAPIRDFHSFEREVRTSRDRYENGMADGGDWVESVVERTEVLVDQCHFLEDKLKIKCQQIKALEQKVGDFEKQTQEMEEILGLQKVEIASLTAKLQAHGPKEEVTGIKTVSTNGELEGTIDTQDTSDLPEAKNAAVSRKRSRTSR